MLADAFFLCANMLELGHVSFRKRKKCIIWHLGW